MSQFQYGLLFVALFTSHFEPFILSRSTSVSKNVKPLKRFLDLSGTCTPS